jgi:hypothetical protein
MQPLPRMRPHPRPFAATVISVVFRAAKLLRDGLQSVLIREFDPKLHLWDTSQVMVFKPFAVSSVFLVRLWTAPGNLLSGTTTNTTNLEQNHENSHAKHPST